MYLSYFDDSGSEPSDPICVFGGVVIPGDFFGHAEAWSTNVIEHLQMDDTFKEFKAHELYNAGGAFRGRDKQKCKEAFLPLLNLLRVHRYPFIYSAVDRAALQKEGLFRNSPPVTVAFEMCLDQLEQWARTQNVRWQDPATANIIHIRYESMCLVVADECDPSLRKQMLTSFRAKRIRRPIRTLPREDVSKRMFHIHDSMYFGDSVDSVGLQIADAANWAMHRYLTGQQLDANIRDELLAVAICAKPEPEWSKHRQLFKDHADVSFSGAVADYVSTSGQQAPDEDPQ